MLLSAHKVPWVKKKEKETGKCDELQCDLFSLWLELI